MDKRTAISPEISKSRTGKNFLYKAIYYYLRPIVDPIKHYILLKRWAHHADYRSFDWDWSEKNYNRTAVVNLLLNKFNNPAYLEIGCASNFTYDSVPVKNKIGVDPSSGGNVRKTSDEFFLANRSRFDVVFIDGLHTYEQVRRDVINAMKALNDGGWIAVHDMLPRNWIEQHIPIVSRSEWSGDVWKVAFELSQTEGVEFKILKIDYGIGVIKVLEKRTGLKDLTTNLLDKEFDYYYDNINKLPIVEWQDAQEWLRS